jgi:hypothetical protein
MKNLDALSEVKDRSLYVEQNSAILQSETRLQKSTTVEFFKTLYNYPPNFRLKLNNLQEVNCKNTSNKAEKQKYKLSNYLAGFKNKIVTSKKFQTNDLNPQYFNSVPVYVILNGSGEIVLGKTMLSNSNQLAKNPVSSINGKIYDLCGSFEDNNLTRESHLGLFFLSKKDAEAYMKEILVKDNLGVSIQGISINCTSLISAYNLMCEHHPGFDFRFVPDMEEVISLMKTKHYTRNVMSVINSSNKPLDLILEKIDRLDDPITTFYWDHLSNSDIYNKLPASFSSQNYFGTWSGVPAYLVNENKTTYVFLSYTKAKKFVDLGRKNIESMNKGYEFETLPISKDFSLRVTNLENLLEFWSKSEKNIKEGTKFVVCSNGDQKEVSVKPSFSKLYQEAFFRKCRIVNSYWSTMLYN